MPSTAETPSAGAAHQLAAYAVCMTESSGALRPAVERRSFDEQSVKPFVEDAAVREQRRKEAAAELLREYEAEHGAITEDELNQLDSEWLT
jgi:hypothetical protein